ncbi:helix-turn-helix domain-containing protein [Stenotrophomonas sp.]|uniref:helix-turn-helix domain-containing protein n=1 Tax=Stenotrophomonas sp. TaxID=69392 RepID=UPI0019A9EC3F|nr:helix-turn-helix domain-containing protein [Stenotrophomonas sp.]MBD3827296.1 helix-turn-helix domain-containing protein [Stenotrophomonas sp.]MCU1113202.1 helix-turn-helix domain-containing protein [Stenotrophomonas maltophilia]
MTHQTTQPAAERLSYTVDEACAVTGLNRNAIYRAITLGQISTFKVGRRRMVSTRALRDFIEAREKEAAA